MEFEEWAEAVEQVANEYGLVVNFDCSQHILNLQIGNVSSEKGKMIVDAFLLDLEDRGWIKIYD